MAAQLVAEQFPEWADLPVVPVALNGWDNTTFRLGEELSIRLPSADGYVAQVAKEHRWLPTLAPHLPLPIPEPVAMGRPDVTFPWPWSIYRWIDGEPARDDRICDRNTLAADLARFLTALQAIDASDGPPAGAHSFFRGGPLVVYDAETRVAIERAADVIDVAALHRGVGAGAVQHMGPAAGVGARRRGAVQPARRRQPLRRRAPRRDRLRLQRRG